MSDPFMTLIIGVPFIGFLVAYAVAAAYQAGKSKKDREVNVLLAVSNIGLAVFLVFQVAQ